MAAFASVATLPAENHSQRLAGPCGDGGRQDHEALGRVRTPGPLGNLPDRVDEREKPYGWSWDKRTPVLDVPGLTRPQALEFALVRRFLSPLLPVSLLNEIDPHVKVAEQELTALPKRRGIP